MVASPFPKGEGEGLFRAHPALAGTCWPRTPHLNPLPLVEGRGEKGHTECARALFQLQEAHNGDDFGRGDDVPLAACIESSRPCRWGIPTDGYSAGDHAFMIKTHPAPLTLGVGSRS
jgi:hypothetical protein